MQGNGGWRQAGDGAVFGLAIVGSAAMSWLLVKLLVAIFGGGAQ